ncbi:MAG: hypothetical protein K1X72_04455 [Pyrinomonadaceae bacterium]|nr:hypothetical protein [Pyrinomonadaceae bacterium]
MSENSFQCVDKNENLESCKGCKSFDFQMSPTQENSIICAHCGLFLKQLESSPKSAGEILEGMLEFARRNTE